MALVENIQRHVGSNEIALYQRFDEIQLTQEQMSERVGKTFYNCQLFKTFKLDPIIQTGIRDGFMHGTW
jgi:hypothetical protein